MNIFIYHTLLPFRERAFLSPGVYFLASVFLVSSIITYYKLITIDEKFFTIFFLLLNKINSLLVLEIGRYSDIRNFPPYKDSLSPGVRREKI